MNFLEVMECILIGIVTGMVTSGITSIIVYHITEYQKELEVARKMIDNTYNLQALLLTREQFEYGNINDKPSENIAKAISSENLKDAVINAGFGFSMFDPWKFQQPIKSVLLEINEILSDGRTFAAIDENKIGEVSKKLSKALDSYSICEKSMLKDSIKQIFRNCIIKVSFIALLIVIILTAVA